MCMRARTRTQDQIRKDIEKIIKSSKNAKTYNELTELSGLTYSQIITTLKKFPSAKEAIDSRLSNNRIQKKYRMAYVVDASITGVQWNIFNDIVERDCSIVLLTKTIEELDKLQKNENKGVAQRAHALSEEALYDKEHFTIVDYETKEKKSVDNTIIEYCKKNKNRIILLTADKNMALKAKGASILVEYYAPSLKLPPSTTILENGEVVIDTICQGDRSIRVYSRGYVYENLSKPYHLKNGDEIYVATKVKNYINFEHYKMLNNAGKNKLVYRKNLSFSLAALIKLPRQYRGFIDEFKKRKDGPKSF